MVVGVRWTGLSSSVQQTLSVLEFSRTITIYRVYTHWCETVAVLEGEKTMLVRKSTITQGTTLYN